jgi:hypothetical protein
MVCVHSEHAPGAAWNAGHDMTAVQILKCHFLLAVNRRRLAVAVRQFTLETSSRGTVPVN